MIPLQQIHIAAYVLCPVAIFICDVPARNRTRPRIGVYGTILVLHACPFQYSTQGRINQVVIGNSGYMVKNQCKNPCVSPAQAQEMKIAILPAKTILAILGNRALFSCFLFCICCLSHFSGCIFGQDTLKSTAFRTSPWFMTGWLSRSLGVGEHGFSDLPAI